MNLCLIPVRRRQRRIETLRERPLQSQTGDGANVGDGLDGQTGRLLEGRALALVRTHLERNQLFKCIVQPMIENYH